MGYENAIVLTLGRCTCLYSMRHKLYSRRLHAPYHASPNLKIFELLATGLILSVYSPGFTVPPPAAHTYFQDMRGLNKADKKFSALVGRHKEMEKSSRIRKSRNGRYLPKKSPRNDYTTTIKHKLRKGNVSEMYPTKLRSRHLSILLTSPNEWQSCLAITGGQAPVSRKEAPIRTKRLFPFFGCRGSRPNMDGMFSTYQQPETSSK
jgi:hypothetical protein